MKAVSPTCHEESAEDSFRQFVAARWGALERYAYLLTGDEQTAEEIVLAALATCWQQWRRVGSDSPEAYARAVVVNTAAARRRRRGSQTPPDDHPPAPRSGWWLALADLPPRRRAVVVLRVWEDKSVAETAQVLGISLGAVKSQLSGAMAQLRNHPEVRVVAGLPADGLARTPPTGDLPMSAGITDRTPSRIH